MGLPLTFFLLLVFILNYVSSQEGPIVKTKYGYVQGSYTRTREGRQIFQFLKIPYAQPPIGRLRFKSPLPPKPWKGVKDTTIEAPDCLQQLTLVQSKQNTISGQEDCLYLRVFTPTISPNAKLPVIIYIFGGAYLGLSSEKSFYGPDLLLSKDIVLVTINFRLGVLGFLTTEDKVMPGNYAMKDQTAAMRWVQDNIRYFGGDPEQVTLMGESSGAASVNLHTLSPLSKGLFHNAIIQSGSGLALWGFSEPGILRKRSSIVADLVGCPFYPSLEFLKCLQNLPAEQIVDITKLFLLWDIDPIVTWNPVIEDASCVSDAFLPKNPFQLTSVVPLMIGITYAEGGQKTCSVTSNNVAEKFAQWNREFYSLTPKVLLYNNTAPNPLAITRAIRSFYFKNTPVITPDMTKEITDLYSDFYFTNGVLDIVSRHRGIVYFYYFNYNNSREISLCPILWENPTIPYFGACHLDDLIYLFPMNGTAPEYNPVNPDYQLSLKMIEMWTNFVKYSNPSMKGVNWKPVRSKAIEHLEISNDGFEMKSYPIKERRRFWQSLRVRRY